MLHESFAGCRAAAGLAGKLRHGNQEGCLQSLQSFLLHSPDSWLAGWWHHVGCDTCLGIWRRKGNAEPAFAGVWRWVLLVHGGEVQAGTVPERRLEENAVGYILTPLVQRGPGWPHWGVGPCQLGMEGVLVVGDASGG